MLRTVTPREAGEEGVSGAGEDIQRAGFWPFFFSVGRAYFEWKEPVDQDLLRERECVMQRSPGEVGEAATGASSAGQKDTDVGLLSGVELAVHGSSALSEMGGEAGSSGVGRLRGSGQLEEATSEESRAGCGNTERRLGRDSGPQRVRGWFSLAASHSLGVGTRGPNAWIHPQLGLAKQSFGKEQGARELKVLAKKGAEVTDDRGSVYRRGTGCQGVQGMERRTDGHGSGGSGKRLGLGG